MTMVRLVRVVTLAIGFASLQLTLLAGGPGCAMPEAGSARAVSAASDASAASGMSDMDMTDPSAVSDKSTTQRNGRTRAAERPAPCDQSTAPTTCPTMAPCVFAVLRPSVQVETLATPAPSMVVAALVLTPPSVTAAPELPPPRA